MTIRTWTEGAFARRERQEVARMEKPEEVAVMMRLHAAGWAPCASPRR